jgi:hypothetical protein
MVDGVTACARGVEQTTSASIAAILCALVEVGEWREEVTMISADAPELATFSRQQQTVNAQPPALAD